MAGLVLARALISGMIIDSSITAITIFIIRLLTLAVQSRSRSIAGKVYSALVYFSFGFYFFINLADIYYFDMYDSRLNILFIENLHQMGPIVGSILKGAAIYIAIVLWLLIMSAFVWLMKENRFKLEWRWWERHKKFSTILSLIFLLVMSFLWIGEPFWRIGTFSFGNQALNQLGLNGVYTLAKAIDQKRIIEHDSNGIDYQFAAPEKAVESMREMIRDSSEEFVSALYPLARKIRAPVNLAVAKPNIVIILMEGFSASFVGALESDGQGCSPWFDHFSENGILFTNFYGHETRTHHGLVSTVGSFPSLLRLFITRRRGTESFYTLGTLLGRYGYRTSFIYGYDQGFDHMGFFLRQGGFEQIIDQSTFPSPRFRAQWGVSDEDLFEKANEIFTAYDTSAPFFSVLLTSSNHTPHEVPGYFLDQHPEYAEDKLKAAFAYADYALGQFLEKGSCEKYFRNTIFVIVGDHGEIRDPADRYLKRFQTPGLIYAPYLINSPRRVVTIGGQTDIATTLMHLIGYPGAFHFVGRDLLGIAEDDGFAIMRNDNMIYYRVGDKVLVRDVRDTISTIHIVDDRARMQPDTIAIENDLKSRMNKELESYLQALYYLFSTGKHRCPDD
jgi:phosphoglycerol transferase MdoB-like AlkP superfamily enzyme